MWIHVPNSYLASAPEPGDSTEASTWRSEMLARSATLNAKEAPSSSWLRAWKRGGWMTRQFGRISSPSTAEHGVDAFRASLLEYPANLTAWPERGSGQTTRATSGLSLQPSLLTFDLDGSSSKTSPESLSTTLSASGPNYRRWVTALRKSSSRRRKSAPHTTANASLYWPTARVPTGGGESAARKQELGRTERGGGDLQAAATDWRTPDAPGTGGPRNRQASRGEGHQETLGEQGEDWQAPAADSFRSRGGDRIAEMGLDQMARGFDPWITPSASVSAAGTVDGKMQVMLSHQAMGWLTPTSRDWKGSYSEAAMIRRDGKSRMDQVESQAIYFLPSLPDTADGAPGTEPTNHAGNPDVQPVTTGAPSSASGQTSRRPSALPKSGNLESVSRLLQRRLNPRFVSWLMGWEPEWTSLEPLSFGLPATGSYPNRQPTPFGFSGDNWTTPVGSDTGRTTRYQQGGTALSMQADNWPSPDTQNSRGGQMRAEAHGKHAVSLHHVIEGWAE